MEEEKKKASKKKKIVTAIIVMILIAIIAVLAFVIYKLLHQEPEPRNASEGLIVDEEEYDKAEDATFTTDMNMVWIFPSGKRTSTNARMKNSDDNEYDFYFEVYLEDEDKTDEENLLYSSQVLPVGKRLKKLKLDRALPDGDYPAVCTFHMLDDEDPNKEISKVSFGVTLIFGEGTESGL